MFLPFRGKLVLNKSIVKELPSLILARQSVTYSELFYHLLLYKRTQKKLLCPADRDDAYSCSCLPSWSLHTGTPIEVEWCRWDGHGTWQRRMTKKLISTLTHPTQAVLPCCCSGHTRMIDLHCRLHREELASSRGCRCFNPSIFPG